MTPSHRSRRAKPGPGTERSGQKSADDIAPSTSSLSHPGSSAIPRYENTLRRKQPAQDSDQTAVTISTASHFPRQDSQSGSSEANHGRGFFAGASHVNASHSVFNDIAGDRIVEIKGHELDKLPRAKAVGYQSANHDTCLTGTRKEELRRIQNWEADDQNKRVYWLNGMAGTGKSTISKTFAERSFAKERLGASFFCSRDFDDRRDIHLIFPTLAYHLACQYQVFKAALIQILNSAPDAGHETLAMQLENLIVRPLQSTQLSTTIVIDALDECKDRQPVSAILWLLGRRIDALPRVKFFITGRPEIPIRAGFRLPLLRPHAEVFVLHEVDPASVNQDIELYVRTRLSEIAAQRSDCDVNVIWPTEEEISAVVTKCSGIFIVASIIVEFTKSLHHTPQECLKMITSRPDSTYNEGKSGVDAIYNQIFLQSFEDVNFKMDGTEFFERLRLVVGSIALVFNPLSRADLATLLDITLESVRKSIRSLHSVLIVPKSDLELLRVFHKSFPDYLTDPTRCTDMRFHIDPSAYHSKLWMCSLALMNKKLKKNICDLPVYAMNGEIKDLGERREKYIGGGLEYACKSWAGHLRIASRDDDGVRSIMESLKTFFKYNLLAWLEVLSVIGDLGRAVYSLHDVKAWMVEVDVTNTELSAIVKDSERFVLRFFDVIEGSALHIYHSALFWCPTTSLVRTLYQDDISRNVHLLGSVENSWDACRRAIETRHSAGVIAYSHKDDLIAVCEFSCVEIFEVSTGLRRATLTRNGTKSVSVAFSTDATLVATGCHSGIVDVWDLQTGSHVCALEGHTQEVGTVAFSPCGTMIASGSEDDTIRIWDVSSHGCKCILWGHSDDVVTICWLGAGHTVVSGSRDKTVKVWVVAGKKCLKTGSRDETVRIWDIVVEQCLKTLRHGVGVMSVACSPDSSWIASGSSDGTVTIFDAKTCDVFQTISTDHLITSIRFSTRQQLIYMTRELTFEIQTHFTFGIWDLARKANILLFEYDGVYGRGTAIASDGKSIASSNGKVVQLWQTDITDDRADLNKDSHRSSVTCIAFSGDGHLIASGSADLTVKLWDAATGLCLHIFRGHSSFIKLVTFSPDARFCASAEPDEIRIWDVHTRSLISTLRTESAVIRFSPNGSWLLSVGKGPRYLTLWEAEMGGTLAETKADNTFDDVAFGVDGTSVTLRSRLSVKRWRISPTPSSDHNLPTRIPGNDHPSLPMVFVPMRNDQQQPTPPTSVLHQYRYEKKSEWILDGQGRRVLWIPPNSRSSVSDCCGKRIVVGSPTGKVIFVDSSDHQVEDSV